MVFPEICCSYKLFQRLLQLLPKTRSTEDLMFTMPLSAAVRSHAQPFKCNSRGQRAHCGAAQPIIGSPDLRGAGIGSGHGCPVPVRVTAAAAA